MVGIGAFRVFKRTRLNIEPHSPVKPIKVGFFFEDWVLKSGLRNNGFSRNFKIAGKDQIKVSSVLMYIDHSYLCSAGHLKLRLHSLFK